MLDFRTRAEKRRDKFRFVAVAFASAACAFMISAGAYIAFDPDAKAAITDVAASAISYGNCSGGIRINCIVDGDTLWSGGVKIRIADIDAPEVFSPKCASELALGNRATDRLLQLVNAGPFDIRGLGSRDTDKYGRKLRVLVRNGHSIGDILVSEGLARTWTGRREPWC